MNRETSRSLCRLLSHLLQYPDQAWRKSLPAVRAEAETVADGEAKRLLTAFLDRAEQSDPLEWQRLYVETFDFGKKTNLYLTYAQFGEERERGRALLDLKRRYAEAGLAPVDSELPDYLPLVLEFAAVAPRETAQAVLAEFRPAIRSIRDELAKAGHPYVPLFDLVLDAVPGHAPEHTETIPAGRAVR
jgi:nitrate reductase molybdenum cofactor assembly chaperone NarJ/NarW